GVRDVEIEILYTAISQDRARAEVPDHLGRGGERHGGHDHALARLQANGFQREVQCGGAGIDRDGVLVFEVIGELTLELFRPGPGREPATLERINNLVDFLSTDAGFVEWNFHGEKQKAENRKQSVQKHKLGKQKFISVFCCLLFPRSIDRGGEDCDQFTRLPLKGSRQISRDARFLTEKL